MKSFSSRNEQRHNNELGPISVGFFEKTNQAYAYLHENLAKNEADTLRIVLAPQQAIRNEVAPTLLQESTTPDTSDLQSEPHDELAAHRKYIKDLFDDEAAA